jgi:hypothetical protein
MAEAAKVVENLPGLRESFEVTVQILKEKGVDPLAFAWDWARRTKEKLGDVGEPEFEELCSDGCHPIALAACLLVSESMPAIGMVVQRYFGKLDDRARSARKLRGAAEVLKQFVDADMERRYQSIRSRVTKCPPGPLELARNLELYAKILDVTEAFSRTADLKSPHDLPRFIVSDYVHRATGRWHDREVSALLEWDSADVYDETAHRVWRNRNSRRLMRHSGIVSDLLLAIGLLIGERE